MTVLADIVRDIFGNPFRPVALDPSLLTPTVTALAAQMYESRDFSAMPILADALQDEGCTSAAVLDHCRGPGPHVRGCWVVDQVLGKGHGRLMTEAEWLTGAEPRLMVKLLSGTVSDRKLRLFACAFYHRLSCVAGDSFADAAVEIAERFADGHATADELSGAATEVSAARDALDYSMANRPAHVALDLARDVTRPDAGQGAGDITRQCAFLCANGPFRTLGRLWWTADHRSVRNDMAAQMDLLRDIFGNPFRPVAFSPAWRTDTAVALASQMYESRDFRAMPVLADALQAAGCDNADVLDHCRAPGLHARGCWVVDLVLGKE
ncbi:hypothetical protein [Gemmata sp. SH-PL17]|uniref:hypothetical protein n=1 Tax=Gemmata sp. SH-PL17 TaxID=1630693 RepID=UPI001EF41D09|nr:hypothetical protein [Gemmata sp. SH-PL17]